MDIQRINPDGLAKPMAAYCMVARRGQVVTTAGMLALDANGGLVGEGDIGAQTRQALENLKTALAAAGATLQDVVKTTIFITDLANFKGMNAVYSEYFGQHPPARSTVKVELVLPTLLIEIEAIAVLDRA